jgi:hypothetical protein
LDQALLRAQAQVQQTQITFGLTHLQAENPGGKKQLMNTRIIILVIPFMLLMLYGCRKNIPAGIETTITGKVYDPKTNKPITQAGIYIQEYEPGGMYPPQFMGIIDSARTDNDGNYQINFTTTGRGTEYRITFSPGNSYDPITVPKKIQPGRDTVINFVAFKIHTLKARVIVTNNYNPPLKVYTRLHTLNAGSIHSLSADTTIYLSILPDQYNEVFFNIKNVDTPSLYNMRIDTLLFQGFTDTFQLTFQVDPRLFFKRL